MSIYFHVESVLINKWMCLTDLKLSLCIYSITHLKVRNSLFISDLYSYVNLMSHRKQWRNPELTRLPKLTSVVVAFHIAKDIYSVEKEGLCKNRTDVIANSAYNAFFCLFSFLKKKFF